MIAENVIPNSEVDAINEIERFQSGSWVSPPEAVWRILTFDLYDMQPAVMSL